MGFYGKSFSFNGIPSEEFGLRISELDADGVNQTMGSASIDIVEDKIYRKYKPYFYGVTASPKMSFPMSAFSETDIDGNLFAKIQKAYFSARNYKKFQIHQEDLSDIYFESMLIDPQITKIGNVGKGISFTVLSSSPFAWHFPKMTAYTFTDAFVSSTVTFNNQSDYMEDYLYPMLTITMNSESSPSLYITNLDDGNRRFELIELLQGEIITMDCLRQTLISSTGFPRLSKFNKRYLRLVNGQNRLQIQGNVSSIVMTTQFISKKI
jgi:phage-related protein